MTVPMPLPSVPLHVSDRRVAGRSLPVVAVVVLAASLGACIAPPKIVSGPSPDDASVRVPALAYQPVTGGVKSYRPVEPKGWEELNRQVTPKTN